MKKLLSIILVVVMLTATLPAIAAESKLPFTDVGAKKWYYAAVASAYESGIMQGKTETTFAPMENMTRAQLVTILSRLVLADTAGKGASLTFKDVKKNAWYADAVGWAVEKGLVTGYDDNTFRPNANVLRQELAVLFARFLDFYYIELPEDASATLADSKKFPDWAADGINKLCRTGLVGGDQNGKFNPKASANRAEIATILTRYTAALEKAPDPMTKRLQNAGKIAGNGNMTYIYFKDSYDIENGYIETQFLTALGLDPEKYTLVDFSDAELEQMKEQIRKTEDESFFIYRTKVTVTNTVTGESTPETSVTFRAFNTVRPFEFVDPDLFESGIPADYYSGMIEESLYNEGDLGRLDKFFDKLEAGEDVTVSYIGGSITEGAGVRYREYCYAQLATNYLTKHYPDAKITHNNAGISGTPSSFGSIRVEKEVLANDPDIVFVEFACNDPQGSEVHFETYESLLRTILGYKEDIAVVIMLSYGGTVFDGPNRSFHKELGKLYGIPVVDVHNPVLRAINDGHFTSEEFAPDGVHPGEFGYGITAQMITHMYETALENRKTATEEDLKVTDVDTVKPVTAARYVGLNFIDKSNFTPDSVGSWNSPNTKPIMNADGWRYVKGTGNKPFEFTVNAKNIFISAFPKNSGIIYEITIDGSAPVLAYITDETLIMQNEEAAEHKVTIRLAEGFESSDVELYGIGYN